MKLLLFLICIYLVYGQMNVVSDTESAKFLAQETNFAANYDVSKAVNWANNCCSGTGCSECECIYQSNGFCENGCGCTPFVSMALRKGGLGIEQYDWHADLYNALIAKGWHKVEDVHKGDVAFYNEPGAPFSHVCLGVGDDIVDCHNKQACSQPAKDQGSSFYAILSPR